jgi:hypothetical protein
MSSELKTAHPREEHFYLSFMAVNPQFQGMGLGSAILGATLKRIDEAGMPAYLENSNPRNKSLYARAGFVAQKNISPEGAPPLISMWRTARCTHPRLPHAKSLIASTADPCTPPRTVINLTAGQWHEVTSTGVAGRSTRTHP